MNGDAHARSANMRVWGASTTIEALPLKQHCTHTKTEQKDAPKARVRAPTQKADIYPETRQQKQPRKHLQTEILIHNQN